MIDAYQLLLCILYTVGDESNVGDEFTVDDEFTKVKERVEEATEVQENAEIQLDSYLQKIRQEVLDLFDKKLDVAEIAKKNN